MGKTGLAMQPKSNDSSCHANWRLGGFEGRSIG
jgi:hypothetical protein